LYLFLSMFSNKRMPLFINFPDLSGKDISTSLANLKTIPRIIRAFAYYADPDNFFNKPSSCEKGNTT
jgi:hypothetical protein